MSGYPGAGYTGGYGPPPPQQQQYGGYYHPYVPQAPPSRQCPPLTCPPYSQQPTYTNYQQLPAAPAAGYGYQQSPQAYPGGYQQSPPNGYANPPAGQFTRPRESDLSLHTTDSTL